jgi:hypothetical protein
MRLTTSGLAVVIAAGTIAGARCDELGCDKAKFTGLSSEQLDQILHSGSIEEHNALFATTKILPAETRVDLVLQTQKPADAQPRFHIITEINSHFVGAEPAIVRPIPNDHQLIKDGVVSASATLITFWFRPNLGWLWPEGSVHVLGCNGPQYQSVASIYMPISSRFYSGLVWLLLVVLYGFAAFAAAKVDKQNLKWYRYLDPVVLTAGANGKGSLTNLQVLFFSVIVVGLVAYIVARTGLLSNLSSDVLILLGISGGGAAVSKATDAYRNRVDFANWAWFIRKGWLPPSGIAAINDANWRDILTTDGQLDIYHFQSLTFSLVVGGALMANGFTDLASFAIPSTLLGVLGLSQVVYIAGKIVAPPSMKDLNDAAAATRDAEREFAAAANGPDPAAPPDAAPTPPANLVDAIRRAGADKYAAYIDKAMNLKIIFRSVLGPDVPDDLIQPAVRLI